MAGYCKDCMYWRKSTLEPGNERIGVCQIDGKEKDDYRPGCMLFQKGTFTKPVKLNPVSLK